jgi:transcriptional antiterminator NusG
VSSYPFRPPNSSRQERPEPHLDLAPSVSDVSWYAVWTKSRQEKASAARLAALGICNYLPLQSQARQWSDRKQTVEAPLFPGYLFVYVDVCTAAKLEVLRTPGVAGFVGNSRGPAPIPEEDIESVRSVMFAGAECSALPLLRAGDRVRMARGPLAGLEGSLLRFGSKCQLVVSIDIIHRSVAVTVSETDVEPVPTQQSLLDFQPDVLSSGADRWSGDNSLS